MSATAPLQPTMETWLNTHWLFALTPAAGLRRRRFLILLGGVLWGFLAYCSRLPSRGVYSTLNLLFYPARILLDVRVFTIGLIALVCIQAILLIALALLHRDWRRLRYWLLAALALIWVFLRLAWAPYLLPPRWNIQEGLALLYYPLQALLNAQVMQLVLLVALAFWLVYRVAAIYLDDIYELEDPPVARRYLLQTVFASQYNFMEIRGGDVQPEFQKMPIFRIGGPGLVRVHLDSAALFETIEGKPRVIGPTAGNPRSMAALEGFERLRSVIDLCDQMDEYSVEGRTRDGIRIRLKNVNTVFSVYRDRQRPSLAKPYPFDPLAIQRLVYGQGTTSWVTATHSLIRRKFGEFISRHTLSEFLAAIGPPELEQERYGQAELRNQVEQFAGTDGQSNVNEVLLRRAQFHSRADIMTNLFAADFREEAAQRGVQINWIGGGTWEPPDAIVLQRHLEAWKLSRENLLRGNREALAQVEQESQVAELARIAQEIAIGTYRDSKELPPAQALRNLILAYYKLIHEAYANHQRTSHNPAQEEWLRQVLIYLTRFTARWLGGP